MLNVSSIFPFSHQLLIIQIGVIFFSIIILIYFMHLKYKLICWIDHYTDEKIKTLDELDLITTKNGICNSILCLWMGLILYFTFYIIQ
jgi:predicted PurR-regulated permease PerM